METPETNRQLRVLRLPALKAKTGYSTSGIYEMMSRGAFPRPIPLGPKTRGWLEHEVDAHLAACVARRDRHTA